MTELKCWFCKRTALEIYDDYEAIYDAHKFVNDEGLNDGIISMMIFEVRGDEDKQSLVRLREVLNDNLPICGICGEVIRGIAREMVVNDLIEGWEIYNQLKLSFLIILEEFITEALKEKMGGESN